MVLLCCQQDLITSTSYILVKFIILPILVMCSAMEGGRLGAGGLANGQPLLRSFTSQVQS